MNNTNNNKKTPRLPPTDTVQPHQPLLYGSVSPQRPLAAAPPARVAPPTDTQTSVLLGRVDTFVPQRPGMVAVTSSPPQPASFVDSAAAAATAAAASNAQYSSSLSSSSSSGLAPPPPPHGRPRSPSDISSMVSNKPPTDTFSMPFPNGYYRVEFPVKLPSVFPDLLPNPLRYTAASSGFQDFANSTPVNRKPYTLRQQEAKHRTKMMVVITMYNEDVDLFSLTLGAVYKNIEFLCSQERLAHDKRMKKAATAAHKKSSGTAATNTTPADLESSQGLVSDTTVAAGAEGGPISWQDIVVCIVADGRQKCPEKVKVALEMLGCYQSSEGIMTDFQQDPVQAHVFEHTSSVHLVPEPKKGTCRLEASKIPIQYLVCMKEFNKKKIDSHGWAFNAFCPLLEPEVVVLLDMGTNPANDALYHFWKHFDNEPRLGGVCGEIVVDVAGSWLLKRWFNFWKDPLLAAQNFEYKMSNILDKGLQSLVGYITVLPGAFSAYRYDALKGTPLEEYFKAEGGSSSGAEKEDSSSSSTCLTCVNIGTANKYLAEDRILCFEIFNKKQERWLLRYIREARATTDAPDNLGAFLNQRRRWLNGSFFAFLDAFVNMFQIFQSKHGLCRKFGFLLEMSYLMLDTLLTLLGPMNFFGVFIIQIISVASHLNIPNAAVLAIGFLYILLFVFGFIIYVGNNPRGSQFLYTFISRAWMLVMLLTLICLGFNTYLLFASGVSFFNVLLFTAAVVATYGLYVLGSAMFLDLAHIISSLPGYMIMLPTYINMMLPFALSNVHDISWGTRPQEPETARVLPKKNFANGAVTMDSSAHPSNNEIVVDVSLLTQAIQKGSKGEQRALAKKSISVEDQNKNFRFIFLFLFFFVNLFGAAAITFGAFTERTLTTINGTTVVSSTHFSEFYMIALFGCVAFFSLIRFLGCLFFRLTTPSY